jgi:hypothetical protein
MRDTEEKFINRKGVAHYGKLVDPVRMSRMARRLRIEYPGAIYHVMHRGDRREPIFQDDRDRKQFLATRDNCR